MHDLGPSAAVQDSASYSEVRASIGDLNVLSQLCVQFFFLFDKKQVVGSTRVHIIPASLKKKKKSQSSGTKVIHFIKAV